MKSDEIVFRSNNSYYDDPDVYCYTCSKPLQIAYSVENKTRHLNVTVNRYIISIDQNPRLLLPSVTDKIM